MCRLIFFRDPSLLEWEVPHCSNRTRSIEKRVASCTFASKTRTALEAQMTPTPGAFVCSKTCEHRFLWMTNLMYSRELVMKLRRMLTWYFAARVGVCSHAWKQCRCLLFRQSRVGRFSIIYQVLGTWPSNKEPSRGTCIKMGKLPCRCMWRHLRRYGPSVQGPVHPQKTLFMWHCPRRCV